MVAVTRIFVLVGLGGFLFEEKVRILCNSQGFAYSDIRAIQACKEDASSVSLEVELDSDIYPSPAAITKEDYGEESISLFSFNSPPPCAWDLVPEISENIPITGLPMRGLQEVELYLNPPSRGSMLNWEYVAAEFGFSNSRIMVCIIL
ncbi:unnamed protein product [Brugia timori]|uniref:Uncharacterized protein n=1 Tax=Brugia timori TaxID=42155 RepID=A0A3P7WJM8_9BILA|nr:unnamed protein product [Brugia timori]